MCVALILTILVWSKTRLWLSEWQIVIWCDTPVLFYSVKGYISTHVVCTDKPIAALIDLHITACSSLRGCLVDISQSTILLVNWISWDPCFVKGLILMLFTLVLYVFVRRIKIFIVWAHTDVTRMDHFCHLPNLSQGAILAKLKGCDSFA